MQSTSDDEPIKIDVKIKMHDKLRIPQHMKERLDKIILEPYAKAIIGEEAIELSNNTPDRIHTYIVDQNEYNLTGDIPYSS